MLSFYWLHKSSPSVKAKLKSNKSGAVPKKSRPLFTHKDLSTIANPRETTSNDTMIRKNRSRWAFEKGYFFYFVATENLVFDFELFIGERFRCWLE